MAAFTTTYHYDNGDEFPVEWADTQIAAQAFWWNAQHTPFACTPLSTDYLANVWAQSGPRDFVHFSGGEAIDTIVHPDGYMYIPIRPPTPPVSVGPDIQAIRDRFVSQASRIQQTLEEEYRPLMVASCHEFKKSDFSAMTLPAMAARLSELLEAAADSFNLTMMSAGPMMITHLPLIAFCNTEFDEEPGSLAEVLEGGFANPTTSAHLQLWKLAQLARTDSAVMKFIEADGGNDVNTALAALPKSTPFAKGLTKYLAEYGSRAEVWFELSTPIAEGNPQSVLEDIGRMISSDESDPRLATARSARARRSKTRVIRKRLEKQPDKLAEFDRLLEVARQYVPVKESRAYWQMTITGSFLAPCLAAGRLLADHGVLESEQDVFFLHFDEIDQIAADPDPKRWKELVATRRTKHAVQMATNPPAFIGGKYEATANIASDGPAVLTKGEVLKGLSASAGIVEGRAIVVKTLSEAGKLETGDILICNSTSPSWSLLFSRISAVVTTGGGPLSHTAIVAREYKIPCVLNVEGVTSRVQDGMQIRVDGTKGTVELVP